MVYSETHRVNELPMDFAGLLEAWADNERKGDVEFSTILTDRGSEPFNNSEEIFIVVFGGYVFY